MDIIHTPVLLNEVLENSGIENKGLVIDMNLGEGGHSEAFLKKYPGIKVIGVDIDSDIIQKAIKRMEPFKDRFEGVNSWSDEFLSSYKEEKPDLILFDLGLSMYHYKDSSRGFSFKDEKLDMRLDKTAYKSAYDVVNSYREEDLANVIYEYGQERNSRRIAREIVKARAEKKIESCMELHDIVNSCFPSRIQRETKINLATQTFQAIRIEVNDELNRFKRAIEKAFDCIKVGGRIEVISFHSLEDKIAKWYFRSLKEEGKAEILTKKPIIPLEDEVNKNKASRSSKLRVVIKIKEL